MTQDIYRNMQKDVKKTYANTKDQQICTNGEEVSRLVWVLECRVRCRYGFGYLRARAKGSNLKKSETGILKAALFRFKMFFTSSASLNCTSSCPVHVKKNLSGSSLG